MARTKGAKDLRPRRMNATSLQNVVDPVAFDGTEGKVAWVRATPRGIKWWTRLNPAQRGKYVDWCRENEPEV